MDILVTGDVDRPSPQTHNILWLYELIAPLIESVCMRPKLKTHGQPKTLLEWIDLEREISSLDYADSIVSEIQEPTLIVGFEMSKRTMFQANEKKIPWINIGFHPIRFGHDLYMGLQTSWGSCIEDFRVPDQEIKREAAFVRAAMAHKAGIACPPGSVLVVGQTPYDRSLIQDGKLMSLVSMWKEFLEIASNSSCVLYKPHHLDTLHNEEITKDYFGLFKGVGRADAVPIYRLLSEPNIKAVIGMSSSVLREATYFQKESLPLMPCWWENLTPVHGRDFLSTRFWGSILSEVMEAKPGTHHSFHTPNLLRRTSGGWWGYKDLMN